MTAMEVTDEVFETPAPIVFEHSEISRHSIGAIMLATAVQPCAS
jgi:ornithine carbamoyltransferase